MICTYPWLGKLIQRFGIRGTSTGGASIALLGTLTFLYLSSHPLNLSLLAGALFIRGVGMSAVGVPSISAAYASVHR
jgi:MFS family permease